MAVRLAMIDAHRRQQGRMGWAQRYPSPTSV